MSEPAPRSARKKLVFFLRHYNDTDNIVPVIHAWATATGFPVEVLIREPLDSDFRIAYLRTLPNVDVRMLRERIEEAGWEWPLPDGETPARLGEALLELVLPSGTPGALVFDHQQMGLSEVLCAAARRRGVRTAALPHGLNAFYNRMITDHPYDLDIRMNYTREPRQRDIYDYFVCPNKYFYEYYHQVPDDIKIVLGSARYCDEWLRILPTLPRNRTEILPDHPGLRVVLFLRDQGYSLFWQEVIRAIRILTQFPDIHLIVQHHTRDLSVNTRFRLPQMPDLTERHQNSSVQYVDDEISSLDLIEWGDVFLSLATSVVYHPLKLNKPVLELSYITSFYATLAKLVKLTDIRSRDELVEWFWRFSRADKKDIGDIYFEGYRKDVEEFDKTLISPVSNDVLGDHVAFLKEL